MPELPAGWFEARIGDIAEIFDGPHATPKSTTSGPVFLGISSLSGGRLDLAQSGHLSEEDYKKWTKRITPRAGDVVFSYETRLGEAALIPNSLRCCLGRRMGLLRPDPLRVDGRFLLYAYLGPSFQETIRQRTVRGSTVDRIPLVELPQFPIQVPPLDEQQAIAGVLGAVDDKLESNRRRAEVAESLLDVLSAASVGLEVVRLGELVEVDRVSCSPSSLGGALVDHFSLPAFDAARLPHRAPGESIKSNKLVVASESVLVSRLNPSTNRTWFAVPEPGVMAAASTEFMVLRPGSRVGLGGLWLAVRDGAFRSELARRATGTSGSHQRVRPDDMLSIEVPDVRVLDAAQDAEAEGLLRLVHQARTESATLAELRDVLLPELLSGRLRVPLAEDLVGAAT